MYMTIRTFNELQVACVRFEIMNVQSLYTRPQPGMERMLSEPIKTGLLSIDQFLNQQHFVCVAVVLLFLVSNKVSLHKLNEQKCLFKIERRSYPFLLLQNYFLRSICNVPPQTRMKLDKTTYNCKLKWNALSTIVFCNSKWTNVFQMTAARVFSSLHATVRSMFYS